MPSETIRPDPLLTGDDLIAMGYDPGPLFKVALREVEDRQLDGSLTSPAEAREIARQVLDRELSGESAGLTG